MSVPTRLRHPFGMGYERNSETRETDMDWRSNFSEEELQLIDYFFQMRYPISQPVVENIIFVGKEVTVLECV